MEEKNKNEELARQLYKLLGETVVKFLHDNKMTDVDWLTYGIDGLEYSNGIYGAGCDASLTLYDNKGNEITQIL